MENKIIQKYSKKIIQTHNKMRSYLLIDSTYRNRLQFPNPADFEIPFQLVNSLVMNASIYNPTNPITRPYPDYNCQWTNFNATELHTVSGVISSGTPSAPILDESIDAVLGIEGNPYVYTSMPHASNILKGMEFIYNGDKDVVYRITRYDPYTRTVFLDGSIQNFIIPAMYSIYNSSTATEVVVQGDFLERSAVVYLDYPLYLYDATINEIRTVQNYVQIENRFILSEPFSSAWSITDAYMVLSRQLPLNHGSIQLLDNNKYYIYTILGYKITNTGASYTTNTFVYAVPVDTVPTTNAMRFRVTEVNKQGGIVAMEVASLGAIDYKINTVCRLFQMDLTTGSAELNIQSTALAFFVTFEKPFDWSLTNSYFLPFLLSDQYNTDSGSLKISGNATLPLRPTYRQYTPPEVQLQSPYYNYSGSMDLFTSQVLNGVTGIQAVVPLDNTSAFLLVQPFPLNRVQRFDLIPKPLPEPLRGCLNFLVLPFTREGVVGLNFTGTQLTQSQVSCYQMTVMNLILPNLTLDVGPGPLTSALPYVFLEISNVTAGRNKTVLYSNNPNTTTVTFICSISDVNDPIRAKFIKISSDGASQTIKFSPVDTLRLRVSLPNGETFLTEQSDYLIPNEPDPRLQIHAVIEIIRL